MDIQSLSIVVPTHGCMNQCKFCVSRMHKEEYENLISTDDYFHMESYKNRMAFARDNGCNTVMLTGQGEPQQNLEFITKFAKMNSELVMPFRNIEIQTTGAKIDEYMLNCFRNNGITTVSLSVSCLNNDDINSDIINGGHTPIKLEWLCSKIKEYGMNLRLSLNMTKWLFTNIGKEDTYPSYSAIFNYCGILLKADQVTFRKMYVDGTTETPQGLWIAENSLRFVDDWFKDLNQYIIKNGRYLDTLEYGSRRYSVMGMSVVVDEDCMAKSEEKRTLKYLILRPNCKLYTQWDDKGSLLF